jgi:hypothetical protein
MFSCLRELVVPQSGEKVREAVDYRAAAGAGQSAALCESLHGIVPKLPHFCRHCPPGGGFVLSAAARRATLACGAMRETSLLTHKGSSP